MIGNAAATCRSWTREGKKKGWRGNGRKYGRRRSRCHTARTNCPLKRAKRKCISQHVAGGVTSESHEPITWFLFERACHHNTSYLPICTLNTILSACHDCKGFRRCNDDIWSSASHVCMVLTCPEQGALRRDECEYRLKIVIG